MQGRCDRPRRSGTIHSFMPSEKPTSHDGSDGSLPTSEFPGRGDERDSELPVSLEAECSVLDVLPCGYLILDAAGTILFANRDFLRMSNRSQAELIGSGFRKLLTSA